MKGEKTYTLVIGAYTPATMPMDRLADYMSDLANLFGSKKSVHFSRLRDGSTALEVRVDHEDVPKVDRRLHDVRVGTGDAAAIKAYRSIDDRLADDNANGMLVEVFGEESAEIIKFPGRDRPTAVTFGPFSQEGSLDGILVSVGGRDETISVQLQNGDVIYTGCETTREIARELGKHMFEPIRIHGLGRWFRDADGKWNLRHFRIRSFEVLERSDLAEAARALRKVPGSDWRNRDDPMADLEQLREEGNGVH